MASSASERERCSGVLINLKFQTKEEKDNDIERERGEVSNSRTGSHRRDSFSYVHQDIRTCMVLLYCAFKTCSELRNA